MSGRTSDDILTNARRVLSLVRLAMLTPAREAHIDEEQEAWAWSLIDHHVQEVMADLQALSDAMGNDVVCVDEVAR